MKEDKHKIKLVYPDKQAEILLEQEDQQLNRQDEINEVDNRLLQIKEQLDW